MKINSLKVIEYILTAVSFAIAIVFIILIVRGL
jgi:hypothetical protein